MSGNNLTANIIDSAARGHMLGVARANAQSAAEWSREYNGLVRKYNELMAERNDLNARLIRVSELYKEVASARDKYGEMIESQNKTVNKLNSALLSASADRSKAYEYIIELSKALSKFDPSNSALTNPNAILAEVNFYSAKRMNESSERIKQELKSGETTQFSKINDSDQFELEAEKRKERGGLYKGAADKGITEVDKTITPVF